MPLRLGYTYSISTTEMEETTFQGTCRFDAGCDCVLTPDQQAMADAWKAQPRPGPVCKIEFCESEPYYPSFNDVCETSLVCTESCRAMVDRPERVKKEICMTVEE